MKKVKKIAEGESFSAVDIGSLESLREHSIIHKKSGAEITGKVFIKDIVGATGSEVSFNILKAYTDLPYLHFHRKNEEIYIILKGSGEFQVDNNSFPISEGSVIRIAPKGVRGLRNTSAIDMTYIVIQAKDNSMEEYSSDDGERL